MDEEDWDAEIETGISSIPSQKFNSLSINQGTLSPSSKYFSDDYQEKEQSSKPHSFGTGYRSNRGYDRGISNSGASIGVRCRGQDYPKDFGRRRGCTENSNWRGGKENSFRNKSSNNLLRIEVINDNVRKVIGKGGSKIKEIQAESGAHIWILQDEASLSVTPVEIFGTKEQREKAHQLIKDVTIPDGDFHAWATRENKKYEETRASAPKIDWEQLKVDVMKFEKERWADCPEIKKYFYRENKMIANMGALEVAKIRLEKNNITVQNLCDEPCAIPNPVLTFEDAFEHYPEILDTIAVNKFVEPSPIQSQAWPILLSGLDCIGIAQTGTGKTLAFLLPAFIHIDEQPIPRSQRGGPSCLIMSPTRELAQQIEMEVKKFHYRGIKSVCIYGGGDRNEQIRLVQQGVEIVIGTPGRMNDLLMNGFFSVKSVTFLILDEADRMLDMGFEPEIKKILLDIRPDRQTVMTSATWLPDVQRIADQYLKNPIRVNVGSLDLQACHSVTQLVEFINPEDKQERVFEFIQSMGPTDKLIIFVGRKITADDISSNFVMRELPDVGIQCIHGDREQSDREQALEDMKSGTARVLIATDVASRGLDIKDITHVLNYDFPRHIEDYVHRIGRTGRAGRSGTALTFITRDDWQQVGKLIPILEEAGQEVPDEMIEMASRWKEVLDRRAEERNMLNGVSRGIQSGSGCFKCGKEGHFSRECPERGISRGRGGRVGRLGGGRGRDRQSAIRLGHYDSV